MTSQAQLISSEKLSSFPLFLKKKSFHLVIYRADSIFLNPFISNFFFLKSIKSCFAYPYACRMRIYAVIQQPSSLTSSNMVLFKDLLCFVVVWWKYGIQPNTTSPTRCNSRMYSVVIEQIKSKCPNVGDISFHVQHWL